MDDDFDYNTYPLPEGGSVDCQLKVERNGLKYRCSIWDNTKQDNIYTSPGFSIGRVTSQFPLDVAYPEGLGVDSSITIGKESACRVVKDWLIECFKPPTMD